MKKILFIFLLLILSIFNVKAYSHKFYLDEKLKDIYLKAFDNGNIYHNSSFIIKRDDGKIVYCIDPFHLVSSKQYYTEYSTNASVFNLTDEQLDRMNLIAHYGYNYANHTEKKWYSVTQFLIWKELNLEGVYFTDSTYTDNFIMFEDEIKELENLVNSYYTLPNLKIDDYEFTIDTTYELLDYNNVLNNYEIESKDIDAYIAGNKLIVNTKDEGTYNIKLVRKSEVENDNLLYYLSGSQSLLYPGKPKDINFEITIIVTSGDVYLNKYDSSNIDRKEATLKGAIYGLYKDDILIDRLITDEKGYAKINNLALGKYYIKEISPSLGYELDTNIYYFEITKSNKTIKISSMENVIEGDLVINKYYGSDENYELEDGAVFEIYDKFDNLVGAYETKGGKISVKLEYGKYYVVQTRGKIGYELNDKFEIIIDEKKEYNFDLFDKILIVDVEDTFKNDSVIHIYDIFIITGILLVFAYVIYEFYKFKKI